ncbi:hypothetical protein HDU88_004910 [Geranomyces variabilis]|nr:hypothetical protein HDU88_004910 [Geranomyces variabilis]
MLCNGRTTPTPDSPEAAAIQPVSVQNLLSRFSDPDLTDTNCFQPSYTRPRKWARSPEKRAWEKTTGASRGPARKPIVNTQARSVSSGSSTSSMSSPTPRLPLSRHDGWGEERTGNIVRQDEQPMVPETKIAESVPSVSRLRALWENRSAADESTTPPTTRKPSLATAAERNAYSHPPQFRNTAAMDQRTATPENSNNAIVERPYSSTPSSSAALVSPGKRHDMHACDMVVCGIKTLTVDAAKVHEIELSCRACASAFVLRAAHDCAEAEGGEMLDEEYARSECMTPEGYDPLTAPPEAFPTPRAKGLEWLQDEQAEYINIAC